MGAALLVVPGDRRGVAVGRAARPARRACASCWPAARRWSSSGCAWPVLVWLTPAADRPVDLGHERQQHLVADLRLQRPRPARRPGRRPAAAAAAARRRRRRPFGGATGAAAAAQRGARRPGRLAARLRARRRRRAGRRRRACGARDAAHRLADRRRRRVPRPPRSRSAPPRGSSTRTTSPQLAPFTAALVGAGVGLVPARRHRAPASARPLALAAGVATELLVLHKLPGQLDVAARRLLVGGAVAAVALVAVRGPPARAPSSRPRSALLLLAPATWAVQTLGHATSGTFPAGGPAQAASAAAPGGGPGGGSARPPAPARSRARPAGSSAPGRPRRRRPARAPPAAGSAAPPAGGGTGGGGGVRRRQRRADQALAYAKQHGGGTIAVSSQSGAAALDHPVGRERRRHRRLLRPRERGHHDVARGRRPQRARPLGADQRHGGFGGNDGRVGSSQVMAAVARVGRKVTITSGSSTTTLYDLSGRADALAAAGS